MPTDREQVEREIGGHAKKLAEAARALVSECGPDSPPSVGAVEALRTALADYEQSLTAEKKH